MNSYNNITNTIMISFWLIHMPTRTYSNIYINIYIQQLLVDCIDLSGIDIFFFNLTIYVSVHRYFFSKCIYSIYPFFFHGYFFVSKFEIELYLWINIYNKIHPASSYGYCTLSNLSVLYSFIPCFFLYLGCLLKIIHKSYVSI